MIKRLSTGKYLARLHTRSAQIKRTFDRRVDAERWLADNRSRHLHVDSVDRSQILVSECMQQWREWVAEHRSATYQRACQVHGDHIVSWLVAHNAARLNRLTLQVLDTYWRDCRRQPLADQTVQNRCRTLIACLNWCVGRGIIRSNPVKDYRAPGRITHEVPEVPSPHDLQAIFDNLRDLDTRKAFWALLALGCRFSAFAALRAEHVLPSGRLDFRDSVKANLTYRRALPAFPFQLPTDGFLFTCDGNQWSESGLIKRIQRACRRAQIPEITIHTLRHAFCTYMIAGGESTGVVAGLGGWRTMSMLERYRDMSEDYVGLLNQNRQQGYLPIWPENAEAEDTEA